MVRALRVMIVDDMDIMRREIKRFKVWGEEKGFIIAEEAKNGYEALLKLEKSSIDLVITDVKMPKIDGLELTQKIFEKKLCPCVALMSDYSDFTYVREGFIRGAMDYVIKPVKEADLQKILFNASKHIEKMEQEQVYYDIKDIKHISERIVNGEDNAFDLILNLVNKIGTKLNYDSEKFESALKSIIFEIVISAKESKPWIEKFLREEKWKKINLSGCNSFDETKKAIEIIYNDMAFNMQKFCFIKIKDDFVRKVCECVLNNVDCNISLQFVSDRLFMNKTYVSEAFKQKTGISFIEYVTMVKMERACKLIEDENLKIYEISEALGFKDSEYFSKLFKRYTGETPGKFRQNKR